MIDEVFANSGELSRGVFDPFYGEYVEQKIRDKIVVSTAETPISTNAEIEFSVYDRENVLRDWFLIDSYEVGDDGFLLDINKHIAESEIPNGGNYTARYNFFEPTLGRPQERNNVYIQAIGDGRREVRVRPNPGSSSQFRQDFDSVFGTRVSDPLKQVGNFGENNYYRILAWSPVVETDTSGEVIFDSNRNPSLGDSAIVRFENELPQAIEVGDKFWIGEEVSRPYFDKFEIFRETEPDPANELAPPDFTVDTGQNTSGESRFETFDDIITEGETSESFVESAFGENSVDLNVDYTDFENFVHFSSAEERIKNFRFKLRQLQNYIDELRDEGTAAGRKETVRREAESLIGSFDNYERWLFRTSGVPEAYPKENDGSLVSLDVTTQQGTVPEGLENPQGWFPKILEQARRYDDRNPSALRKQIPEFVREDPDNTEFVLFIDLVGHWFDQNWIYIDQVENFSESTESAFRPDSLSADLSRIVAESKGLETYNGFDAEEFFDEVFDSSKLQSIFDGADITKNDRIEVLDSKLDLTRFQAQQQMWRRLLSNLSHQYKTRGTKNSIRMLANIFGVPTGSLVIREYGGAIVNDERQQVKVEETTHNLPFFSSQNLIIPWNTGSPTSSVSEYEDLFESYDDYPKAAEFRFRSNYQGGQPIKLFELRNVSQVRIDPVGTEENDNGKVVLEVNLADGNRLEAESDPIPLFDGDWTSLLFRIREDEPFIDVLVQKRSPIGEIAVSAEASVRIDLQTATNALTASDLRFGGTVSSGTRFDSGVPFIGDLDQVNLWGTAISENRFDIHTLAPTKKDVDNSELSTVKTIFDENENFLRENLIFRLDFPVGQELNGNPAVENESGSGTAIANGFAAETEAPWQFERYERVSLFPPVQVGATSFFTNKIRQEENELNAPLQSDESVENRPLELVTKDSDKVGVFFSPYTSANRDALSELGIDDINALLGNPQEQLDGRYDALNAVNRMYWDKYDRPVNKQEYIRYIDEFYDAFFDHVRDAIPARACFFDGIVIEPSILERDREPAPSGGVERKRFSATANARAEASAEITRELKITASL